MNFNQALSYLQTQIQGISPDEELDTLVLRAMFEDIVIERASEYFQDVWQEVLLDSTDWAKIEELLQSKLPDYGQFVQDTAEAFLAEYKADID